jgi:exopolysaccharide production protein ExoZ
MLKNVQALRALAALLVVAGHLEPLFRAVHPALGVVGLGRAGVDLFFVISGFVMVLATDRTQPSALEFVQRRLVRIAPLYWLVTLAVFGLALAAPRLLGASRPDPAWLLKSLAFIPFDKGDGTFNPLVPVGWTLDYEMFFYAVFALCLTAGARLRYWLAGGLLAALAAPGLAGLDFHGVAAQFYTRPIVAEFAAGMALALVRDHVPAAHSRHAVAAVLGCAAVLTLVLMAAGLLPRESWRVMLALPAATGVLACALALEGGGVTAGRPALAVGDASYSIYLTHLFVTQAFIAVGLRLGWAAHGGPAGAAVTIAAALAAVVATGLAAHRLFETPVTRALRVWPASLRAASA